MVDSLRALFLTKYDRKGASSRYRTFQYLPWLERAGIDCEVQPLFDDTYLKNLYASGRGHVFDILRAFLRRVHALGGVRKFDLVVIEKEVFPYFSALPEHWLQRLGVPYIVDYDDALFHQYNQNRRRIVRCLLGNKIARVMAGAKVVMVGNNYLANYAYRAGCTSVEIIPTVIDLDRYVVSRGLVSSDDPQIIGWIGSRSTAKYLETIGPALAQVCASGRARVRLIGSGHLELPGVPVEVVPWDEATEVGELTQFDLGIMPLPDGPWERGKCGFKLIQYMACGLPIVASPVGVNCEIVESGVNGFLAGSETEWVRALNRLLNDSSLRRRLGEAGRGKVEQQYSLQVTAPRMAALIRSATIDSRANVRTRKRQE